MKRTSGYLMFAAAATLALPLYAKVGTENVLKRTFKVTPGGVAHVRTELGSIEVRTHNSNTVEAQVIRRIPSSDRTEAERILENFEVTFDQTGNDVYVTSRRVNKGWMFRDSKLKVKIALTVPRNFNTDLRTAGGNIAVSDLDGRVEAKTSGGNLVLGRINGPVTAKTSGGNIDLLESRGKASLGTSGGNIRIGEVDGDVIAHTSGGNIEIDSVAGTLVAETSGGNIEIEDARGSVSAETSGGNVLARITAQPVGDSRLHTSGGMITVYLAKNVAVNLQARASGGSVRSDLPVTIQGKTERTSITGKINGGGPALILSSSGGAVEIKGL